jgi:hypothetical protein
LTCVFLELFHAAKSLFKNVDLLFQILNLRRLGCDLGGLNLNGLLLLVKLCQLRFQMLNLHDLLLDELDSLKLGVSVAVGPTVRIRGIIRR